MKKTINSLLIGIALMGCSNENRLDEYRNLSSSYLDSCKLYHNNLMQLLEKKDYVPAIENIKRGSEFRDSTVKYLKLAIKEAEKLAPESK